MAPGAAVWNAIWRLKVPTRSNLLLWMVNHERLKTKQLLYHRQIVEDATCALCGQEVESTLHAVRDCVLPRRIWTLLIPVPSRTITWYSNDPSVWIQSNLCSNSNFSGHWRYIFRQALQDIWQWHNWAMFQRKPSPPAPTVICNILAKYLELLQVFRARDSTAPFLCR